MALVKTFMDGNTKIRIHDDFCVSPEEVQEILHRCGELAVRDELRRREREGAANTQYVKSA